MLTLTTDRLILREWQASDREPFAAINSNRNVMQYFPRMLSRAESDRFADRIEAHFQQFHYGLFAAELTAERKFIGYIGLSVPSFVAAFTPCVEIGWRLSFDHWGQGLATEGAREVARFAFEDLKLPSLVSFTVPMNVRSIRVMEKIGMTHDPKEDFDHPNLPHDHPLQFHQLYRLSDTTPQYGSGK
jgi:RimJ/RimL family protein N-acetyltransferase